MDWYDFGRSQNIEDSRGPTPAGPTYAGGESRKLINDWLMGDPIYDPRVPMTPWEAAARDVEMSSGGILFKRPIPGPALPPVHGEFMSQLVALLHSALMRGGAR